MGWWLLDGCYFSHKKYPEIGDDDHVIRTTTEIYLHFDENVILNVDTRILDAHKLASCYIFQKNVRKEKRNLSHTLTTTNSIILWPDCFHFNVRQIKNETISNLDLLLAPLLGFHGILVYYCVCYRLTKFLRFYVKN